MKGEKASVSLSVNSGYWGGYAVLVDVENTRRPTPPIPRQSCIVVIASRLRATIAGISFHPYPPSSLLPSVTNPSCKQVLRTCLSASHRRCRKKAIRRKRNSVLTHPQPTNSSTLHRAAMSTHHPPIASATLELCDGSSRSSSSLLSSHSTSSSSSAIRNRYGLRTLTWLETKYPWQQWPGQEHPW